MTWNFFESGHGKGAADGVGGSLKRLADNFVATGHDIVDASQFFEVLKDRSKTKLFYVSHDEIAQILQLIPDKVIPLKGTMQVHQLIAERPGLLTYRALSCFCGKYCSCYNVKTYCPLPEEVIDDDSLTSEAEEPLTDITNLMGTSKGSTRTRGHYDKVYSSSTSDDEDKQPLSYMKETLPIIPGTSYDTHDKDKDVVHPLSIRDGVHVLVKIDSDKKKEYKYLGVAKGDMDEDGDVRVMFYKAIGDTGKLFKLNESDVSDVTFEQLVKIVANPKAIKKGRRVLYEFNQPIEVFEKK